MVMIVTSFCCLLHHFCDAGAIDVDSVEAVLLDWACEALCLSTLTGIAELRTFRLNLCYTE
jgi:hypothetical protein